MRFLVGGVKTITVIVAVLGAAAGSAGAGKIYWAQMYNDRIMRADLNGDNAVILVEWPESSDPVAIALDDVIGKVYWAQVFDDRILRADLSGADVGLVLEAPDLDDPTAIAVDPVGGKIYWAQTVGHKIMRADLSGANVQTLLETPQTDSPVAVALDIPAGKLYWAQATTYDAKILRANLNGTNVELLLQWPEVDEPVGIAIDGVAGKIYWAQTYGDRIIRADLGGESAETLLEWPELDDPTGLAVDSQGGKLYWVQKYKDRMLRADLNGDNAEILMEWPELDDAVGIALGPSCVVDADCDDDNVCTDDTCIDRECQYAPNTLPCDDGQFCTLIDQCDGGACIGSGDPCPGQFCNETSDLCVDCLTDAHCPAGMFCAATGCTVIPVPTVKAEGCRYLGVTPQAGPASVALLVTGVDPDVSCVSAYVQGDGTLGLSPTFRGTQDWGTVHVRGADLMSDRRYEVRADTYALDPGSHLSEPAADKLWRWGETNLDGTADFLDITRAVDGFRGVWHNLGRPCTTDADCATVLPHRKCDTQKGYCLAITLENVDVYGSASPQCTPDRVLNFDDITRTVDAFVGRPYPCPVSCP
jgi:hypothetical protein